MRMNQFSPGLGASFRVGFAGYVDVYAGFVGASVFVEYVVEFLWVVFREDDVVVEEFGVV